MDKLTTTFQSALQEPSPWPCGGTTSSSSRCTSCRRCSSSRVPGVGALLGKAGANLNLLRSKLGEALDRLPQVEGTAGDVHGSQRPRPPAQPDGQARPEAGRPVHLQRALRPRRLRRQGRARQDPQGSRRREGRPRQGHRRSPGRREPWTTRTPRKPARPWRSTPSTSPPAPSRASSTPSSAATTRSAARSRCSSGAPRTTPCSSASPASARRPSWRASPSASSTARCPRA